MYGYILPPVPLAVSHRSPLNILQMQQDVVHLLPDLRRLYMARAGSSDPKVRADLDDSQSRGSVVGTRSILKELNRVYAVTGKSRLVAGTFTTITVSQAGLGIYLIYLTATQQGGR